MKRNKYQTHKRYLKVLSQKEKELNSRNIHLAKPIVEYSAAVALVDGKYRLIQDSFSKVKVKRKKKRKINIYEMLGI